MTGAETLTGVIMAGGMGTRFWPLSTRETPKQFIKLLGDTSLLQQSYAHLAGILAPDRILVLTNRDYVPLVREQLPTLPPENVIGEPMRRDTAAAVCLGALLAKKRHGNPVIVTVTADHLIEPAATFQRELLSAAGMARDTGALYTLGIRPTYPATAYGYLELGGGIATGDGCDHFQVQRFREKPDPETAREFVASGRHLWNSGMFVWTADAILEALRQYLPDHVRRLSVAVDRESDDALHAAFEPLERISIDYAVMEKAPDVRCVAGTFAWKDLGGWLAMHDYLAADAHGNVSNRRLHTREAGDNLVFAEDPAETVVLLGVNDLVVVRSGARTLVAAKDHLEDLKRIVEDIE